MNTIKFGDFVTMNDKYHVSEANRGKIFEVTSEPWEIRGTKCVLLSGYRGGYAVDGLDIAEGRRLMNECCSFLCKNKALEHKCYCQECTDRKEKEKADNIANSLENGKFECEREIYCPHCGAETEVADDYELFDDGEHEIYCCDCDKLFTVNTNTSYSFDTRKGGIDDERG